MSEDQHINIKQRIIGALVLVSLGIIIIPMLLNGGVTTNQSISGDNIPVMPQKLKTVLPQVPQAMMMPEGKKRVAKPERSTAHDSKPEKKSISGTVKLTTVKKNTEDLTQSSSKMKYKQASKPASAKINMAYTIQIASFSKKTNADALKQKLRKKKHKAYIESVSTSKGKIYRLRVGPYLKFEQISTIKKQIEKQFKLKNTVIIKY